MITVQIESFADNYTELSAIFPRHWQELGLFRDRMPLDPQYREYRDREGAGRLFMVTIRRDGRIVGYYTAQVAPGFHYGSTLTGTMDMMFIIPDERGKGLVVPLFKKVEEELRRRGVKIWYSGYKSHNPLQLDRVLPALGFQPADTYMAKWIGDDQ